VEIAAATEVEVASEEAGAMDEDEVGDAGEDEEDDILLMHIRERQIHRPCLTYLANAVSSDARSPDSLWTWSLTGAHVQPDIHMAAGH
jgi:hypothetical protein